MENNHFDHLEKKLSNYQKKLNKNFSVTLNDMINDLDPTININEYSRNFSKRVKSDPFYYLKFKDMGREKALDKYKKALESVVESNGSRYFKKTGYSIGIISDEFLYESFKDVADFTYISWQEKEIKNFDFVIFASTWRGIDNSWEGVAHPNNEKRKDLIELIEAYNQANIPTIFYSKEDPVNYHLFKSIASHCKYIFTTAAEKIEDYIKDTGNLNVNVLQFGINPSIHNPVGSRNKIANPFKNDILFAGSWLSKYPVRMNETERLFDSVKSNGAPLIIIDRNLRLENPRYQFPSKYLENLAPPLPHKDLMTLHKIIRWSINMNSVKYSATMFANRVYELQAFGNILLSNYNTAINNMFPNIRMINTSSDFKLIYNMEEDEIKELQAKGIRNVFREHTTYHRINQIASTIGFNTVEEKDSILVVLKDDDKNNIENFKRQIYANKTMVLEKDLSSLDLGSFDYITFFDSQYLYEEYYLEDMISAFKYVDVDFVTKNNKSQAHNYVDNLESKYMSMIDMALYSEGKIKNLTCGYNLDDSEVKSNKIDYSPIKINKELSVIIPIHNNGTYLEEKCFASLKRSTIFNKMEIIFINDGSTDDTTLKIINRLRRRYPDIVYVENKEGSGGASKPRNQGVRFATTKYITYLDPDNEATGDGYRILFEKIKSNDVDMVVGNIIKEDTTKRNAGKYTEILKRANYNKLLVTDPKAFLIRSDLRVQSIQALIVKKSVIINNELRMVEGAAGQDTMFYQELVLNSKSILGVATPVHIYYAAVTGSVTNTISFKFFEKYYKLEQERIPYLIKYGLLDTYLAVRYQSYIQNWYLTRLEKVVPEERSQAVAKFLDIIKLYDQFNPKYNRNLKVTLDRLKQEVK